MAHGGNEPQFTGMAKYFNTFTTTGRANVSISYVFFNLLAEFFELQNTVLIAISCLQISKATLGSAALLYLILKLKPSKKNPEPAK